MLDFVWITDRSPKKGVREVYPKFILGASKDLMVRGKDFYAVWDEENKTWSTDENRLFKIIDSEISDYVEKKKQETDDVIKALYMWDGDSGSADKFHKYVQKQMRDNYIPLDSNLTFMNDVVTRESYSSKRLKYVLEPCPIPAYDELISKLYSPEERHKIEWAIGSIFCGESQKIQKFLVFYGPAGTGKSTVLNIIQDLFEGYYCVFDAKALGSASSQFALETLRSNPLVAIQHDGDLSKIEDNTKLNSVVSHEEMTVNEKFKAAYTMRFNCFLFMGTNRPVRITDSRSGIIRRLIDVNPTGEKLGVTRYRELMDKIKFEHGGIACHCMDVYREDPYYYDGYIPTEMFGASNDFYNYILDSFEIFKKEDSVSLKAAWEMYKAYCDDARVPYPYSQKVFKEELKSYFREFEERSRGENGTSLRNIYSGFISDKFESKSYKKDEDEKPFFELKYTESLFDEYAKDWPAQYASVNETPLKAWSDVTTTLKDIDTRKLHYINPPDDAKLIFVDFDLKDENGNKSFELNAYEASKWPPTYSELSKGGEGIHLYYIYDGDPSTLSHVYAPNIEIKTTLGGSAIRRKVIKCNSSPIAHLSSGLPQKETKKMINFDGFKSEKALRASIERNLRKENIGFTKPSIDFIFNDLEKAYASGLKYDVTNMIKEIENFAEHSSNSKAYCMKKVSQMKFKSDEDSETTAPENEKISDKEYKKEFLVFYDVEVFPNLFIVCYKSENGEPHKLINPGPKAIESLIKMKLVGFNCRKYDNHILWARLLGYTNEGLYRLSQDIISKKPNVFFGEAYNLSYADVLDFSTDKKSLKKFEIELGIHHQECPYRWDEDVPKEKWDEIADYCINDVVATQKVFESAARQVDWHARKMLVDIANASTGGIL